MRDEGCNVLTFEKYFRSVFGRAVIRVSVAFHASRDLLRKYSDLLKSKDVKRVDKAIIATALLLDGKNVPFNVANLLGEDESSKMASQSIDSFGVFLEMDQFTDEEIEALIAERLEILATRSRNRLLCKTEIANHYYVI